MKEKIETALKTKYSNLGFDVSVITAVAEYLGKSVQSEEQINEAVSGVESVLKVYQSSFDKARGEKSKQDKEIEELKAQLAKKESPIPPKDDIEERLNALIDERVKSVQTELDAYKSKEAQARREAFITAKAKEVGVPDYLQGVISIPSDADETKITETLTSIAQNIKTNSLPIGGNPVIAQVKVEASEDSTKRMFRDLNR